MEGSSDQNDISGPPYLRKWRKALGLKAPALAEVLEIERESYYRLEKDPQKLSAGALMKLSQAMKIKPEQLWMIPPPETQGAPKGPKSPLRMHLAAWRDHRGLTQQQLADRIGTSSVSVSRWETDNRRPDLETQAEISQVLNIEPADLLRHPSQPSADALLRDQPPEVVELALKLIQAIRR